MKQILLLLIYLGVLSTNSFASDVPTSPYIIGYKLTQCKTLKEATNLLEKYGFYSIKTFNNEVALFRNSEDYIDPASFYLVTRKDERIAIISADIPVLHMGQGLEMMRTYGYSFMFNDNIKNPKGSLIKRIVHYSENGWLQTEFGVKDDIIHNSNFVTFCRVKPEANMYQLMEKAVKGDLSGLSSMIVYEESMGESHPSIKNPEIDIDVKGMINIADKYEKEKEYEKAYEWYKKAFKAADVDKLQSYLKDNISQKQQALYPKLKKQREDDKKKSEQANKKNAIETSNSTDCFKIAHKYKKKKDYKNAAEWYFKAVLCDGTKSFMSKYYLGILYLEGGNGLKPDHKYGAYWLYNALDEAETEHKREFDLDSDSFDNVINKTNILKKIEAYRIKGYITDQMFDSFKSIDEKVQKQLPPNVDRINYETKERHENSYAIVISNEDYKYESSVTFATRDGNIFAAYCNKFLGIPEKNIYHCNNGSYNQIVQVFQWLRERLNIAQPNQTVVFYYAGHGIPNEADCSAYLLPTDGFGSDPESGFSLKKLCQDLSSMTQGRVLVFLDACFSGTERSGKMMDGFSRGVAIKVKSDTTPDNVVIFSASQGDQTAYPYKQKKHGLFTYYLLEKLMNSKGEATMQEIQDYVTSQVTDLSTKLNGKEQVPSISHSVSKTDWKKWKLK